MKLYEINKALTEIIESANPETGEIDEQALNMLVIAKEEKQKNIVMFCNQLGSDSEAIEKEIERLENMKKRTANLQKWLMGYLKSSMETDGVTELDFVTFKAKIKKNPPKVEVESDYIKLPEKFWVTKVSRELNKKAIKEAIENGVKVQGAKLIQDTRIEIK